MRQRPGCPVLRAQRGQGLIEYALIIVAIALLVIAVLTLVGKATSNAFCQVSSGLSGKPAGLVDGWGANTDGAVGVGTTGGTYSTPLQLSLSCTTKVL